MEDATRLQKMSVGVSVTAGGRGRGGCVNGAREAACSAEAAARSGACGTIGASPRGGIGGAALVGRNPSAAVRSFGG
jgi:hypothetical protein